MRTIENERGNGATLEIVRQWLADPEGIMVIPYRGHQTSILFLADMLIPKPIQKLVRGRQPAAKDPRAGVPYSEWPSMVRPEVERLRNRIATPEETPAVCMGREIRGSKARLYLDEVEPEAVPDSAEIVAYTKGRFC